MDATSLEELVCANIQEVLDAVAGPAASRQAGQASSTCGGEPAGPRSSGASAGEHAGSSPGPRAAGSLDTGLLEVPANSDATIRLLKARIRSLEEQLATALRLNADKEATLAELQKQAKLSAQREAAASKSHKALEAQVERHKRAAEAAREALAAREQQVKELSKEGAKADKDRRLVEEESRARDVRLQRALEEVEQYKQLLTSVKQQGQEVKDVARTKASQALSDVKRLERQAAELLVVLRKQAKLIEVLRRQRAHLEAAQLLGFTEEEFMRTLDARA